MIYVLILGPIFALLLGGIGGYCLGRYQTGLLNKIRTLTEQGRQEPASEPEKPAIAGGAYQPPKEISASIERKKGAGLVETKTPQLLEWENKQALEKLIQGG